MGSVSQSVSHDGDGELSFVSFPSRFFHVCFFVVVGFYGRSRTVVVQHCSIERRWLDRGLHRVGVNGSHIDSWGRRGAKEHELVTDVRFRSQPSAQVTGRTAATLAMYDTE